jgi:peptidylprolyl isomerase
MNKCCYKHLFNITVLAFSVLIAACDKPQGQGTAMNNQEKKVESTNTNLVTLPSGLKYEVLQRGATDAKKPARGQMVIVHYTGWLDENGKQGRKFDSSVDRGEKFTFKIGMGQVIKGWDEGVMDMQIGEKRRLIIPSQLGYGAYGAGGVIPPHATLIFDVELFDIR